MSRIFGSRSRSNLATCHPMLVKVAENALQRSKIDFTVIEGHRGKEAQDKAYRSGHSKVRFPGSAHNQQPSCALDVIPYPFKGWNDRDIHNDLRAIAEAFFDAAKELGVTIRWGGNWSVASATAKGTGFVDSPHFELHPWREWVGE